MAAYYANNVGIFINTISKTIEKYVEMNENPLNKNNYNINLNYFFNIGD